LSLQVAKVKGIPIKLHFTLAIVFALIAWTLAVSYMPLFYPSLPQSAYWTMGILGAIILFISVLLHELSHSMVAKRYGFKVRQIILFVFGGVSDIKEEPKEDYKKEFMIAIVGPISSFALAGLFAAVWFLLIQAGVTDMSQTDTLFALPPSPQQQEQAAQTSPPPPAISEEEAAWSIAQGVMRYGAIVNILLGGFNLLPAFPLDGGRVLRAGLMRWKRSYDDATKTAVKVGVGISYGLMAFGFLTIFTGSFTGGIWLILIGWFLQSGAQSYLQQHEITTALSGVRLHQIMNTQFIAVTPGMNIKEVLEGYFNIYRKSELPVVEKEDSTGNNYLLGAITAKDAMNVSEKNRESVKVEDIMIEKKDLVIMSPDRTADVALNTIMKENKSRIYVCENPSVGRTRRTEKSQQQSSTADGRQQMMTYSVAKSDRLVGIISKTDLLNIAKERMEYTETLGKKI
jgi:Zn-dependent protease/predicted transcriptional regulator